MTGKQALLELLQRDGRNGDASKPARDAWLRDLHALMRQFAVWLGDSAFAGKLALESGSEDLAEDDLTYQVPTLTVTFQAPHQPTVKIRPRGMQIVGGIFSDRDGKEGRLVGASGRVDIMRGPIRATLLRFIGDDGTTWRWLTREGELDEDSFFEVLHQLIA